MLKDFFKRDLPLRDTVYRAVRNLQAQHSRLELASAKMVQRKKILFDKCALAIKNGQKERATIYANEIVEIKKMICNVSDSQINIERVILRLETVMELGDAVKDLSSTVDIVQDLAKKLAPAISEATSKLDDIKTTIAETLEITTLSDVKPPIKPTEAQVEGAKEILREAAAHAEKMLKNRLPEPPIPVIQRGAVPATEVRQLVALTTSSCGAIEKTQPLTKSYLSYTDVKSRRVSVILQQTPIVGSQTLESAEKMEGQSFGNLSVQRKDDKQKEKELVKVV